MKVSCTGQRQHLKDTQPERRGQLHSKDGHFENIWFKHDWTQGNRLEGADVGNRNISWELAWEPQTWLWFAVFHLTSVSYILL